MGYIQAIPATTGKCDHLLSDCKHAMFVSRDFRAKNDGDRSPIVFPDRMETKV